MKNTIALILIAAFWLSGCSSRSDEGDTITTVDPGLGIGAALDAQPNVNVPLVSPGQLVVFSEQTALLTGSSEPAVITAIVSDDSNRALQGHEVIFSTDAGFLRNIQAITDENGEATAELNLLGDFNNRTITVTATVEGLDADVQVLSGGTSISLESPEGLVVGDTANLVFTLLSGAETPVANEAITLSSDAGNAFSQNTIVTDAFGVATVSMTTSAGIDIITASALSGTVLDRLELVVAENVQAITTPIRIRVISNESEIETGGNDVARITTLVTDESNRVLADQEVIFSSTGGVLQNISNTTNEAGQATAELSLAGDFRNQNITVTASLGNESSDVVVNAAGSKIAVAGATALVSGDVAELEITLTGGNDQPVPNEVLSVRSVAGNSVEPSNPVTDADGKVTIFVTSDNGSDRIVIAALDSTVSESHEIQVAADVLRVLPQSVNYESLPVDQFAPLSVEWTSNGFPVAAQLMRFSVTAGVVRTAGTGSVGSSSVDVFTDANGVANVEIASTSAGPVTVAFADSNDADPVSQFAVEFVATLPNQITLDAAPASIATGNSGTVSALVTDAFGNPVKDTVVEFSSPDLRGGTLSPVSAVTDSDGRAAVTFTAGNLPTETDGISISGFLIDHPTVVPSQTQLTITERQLNVIIGLSGELEQIDSDTRYRKTGVVQVTDGAGRPVPDATILVTMVPTVYRYGSMIPVDSDNNGDPDRWALQTTSTCVAEDLNGNRILDTGEDVNFNGELDPRDPALIDADDDNSPTVIGNEITTDASGVGFFSIAYPQSNALYFDVQITARVEALGTEGVANFLTGLPVATSDIEDLDVSPPNAISPYGIGPAPFPVGCI